MRITFKNNNLINIACGVALVGSLVTYTKTSNNLWLALTVGLCGGTQLSRFLNEQDANQQLNEIIKVAQEKLEKLESQNSSLELQAKEAFRVSGNRKTVLEDTQKELLSYRNSYQASQLQIEKLSRELQLAQDNITREIECHDDSLEEIKGYLIEIISNRISNQLIQVENSIQSNLKKDRFFLIQNSLQNCLDKVSDLAQFCNDRLEYIKLVESNQIQEIFTLFCEMLDKITSLRLQYRNLLNTNERKLLHEVYAQFEELKTSSIDKQKAVLIVRNQSETQRGELEKIYQHSSSNDASLENLQHQISDLLAQIEQKNLEILRLKEPQCWQFANRRDLLIGNTIIQYFFASPFNFILDRAKAEFNSHESTLSFHIDRNSRIILADELNQESERLQQLCHTLSPIKFTWNADEGLMTAYIHLARKPKKETSEDITKLWKPAKDFQKIVSSWNRIRITGGSEAGKSPTAENLAVCICQSRNGQAEVCNPQFGSRKDFWTIPQAGKSHEESAEKILLLADDVSNKVVFKNYKMFLFDEVDSTMSQYSEPQAIGKAVNTIIKQASHSDFGVIFIGQNANVKHYPGMDRSDWNSAVNLHIGANSYDAIENSNQLTTEQKQKLKTQADKLTAYCDDMNQSLALTKHDPQAYRFALVLNDGNPYFIQLPDFGAYTYDCIEVIECPKCNSKNVARNGKVNRKCKDCNHQWRV
jgi:hypothetical protein